MAQLSLRDLKQRKDACELIIESLENCLYQAFVKFEQQELALVDNKGKSITAPSMGLLVARLSGFEFSRAYMRQRSPYDEMIGQPGNKAQGQDNDLHIPIDIKTINELVGTTKLH